MFGTKTRRLWSVLFLSALLFGCPAMAASPSWSDGDELDERIETAMLGVRADRPWRLPGAAATSPVSWQVGAVPQIASRPSCSGWTFSFTPYLWVPGISGSLTVDGNEVDIDSSVSDSASNVISHLEFGFLGRLDARRDEWSFIFNTMYLHLGADGDAGPAGGVDYDVDFKMALVELFAGYRFANLPLGCPNECFQPSVWLEAQVGARYHYMGVDVELSPGPDPSGSVDWIDPLVGLRAVFNVTPKLTFDVMANIGGFGVGSEFAWSVVAGAAWRINHCVSLVGGWAILDERYESGSIVYDVRLSGPYLGAMFRF